MNLMEITQGETTFKLLYRSKSTRPDWEWSHPYKVVAVSGDTENRSYWQTYNQAIDHIDKELKK